MVCYGFFQNIYAESLGGTTSVEIGNLFMCATLTHFDPGQELSATNEERLDCYSSKGAN